MRVIGTAGHVDHGKSTLVKVLTGIDPDRLKEEKKRQMTIDLGFAWYESPGVGSVGIVDVPGHRDFIENMLAGVGGLDAVMFVIAADEGVMPQTREHLAIIDLLKIQTGLVVLTKADLVEDPDWFDLIENDIRQTLKGTVLENAPLLRVSATTGDGIQEVKHAIDDLLRELGPRIDLGRARLPIDRVFTITGFGTVVTGTLVGGKYRLDEQVEILPGGKKARVRGLQSHKKQESEMLPGTRVAINLAGVDAEEVRRGDTIVHPGQFVPTRRIDARLEMLRDAPTKLKHNDQVKLFLATTETTARVRLLQQKEQQPGGQGWVQLETEKELVCEKGDRFIIRRMSPANTIGGGVVVDAHPKERYKLSDALVITRLEASTSNTLSDRLKAMISENPFISEKDLISPGEIHQVELNASIESLVASEAVKRVALLIAPGWQFVEMNFWRQTTRKALEVLQAFHAQNPLRAGMHHSELARRIRVDKSLADRFIQAWVSENQVKVIDEVIALASFEIRYSQNQKKRIQELNALIDSDPFNPPNLKDARVILTEEVYQALVEQGELVQVSPEVFLRASEYNQMKAYVTHECGKGLLLTLAQFRDHFATSRKYAQAFLEHLDRAGVTIREGEGRKLKNSTNII
jgi:selenocysteine-specific elongation factor